jgi:hypothetical protein
LCSQKPALEFAISQPNSFYILTTHCSNTYFYIFHAQKNSSYANLFVCCISYATKPCRWCKLSQIFWHVLGHQLF